MRMQAKSHICLIASNLSLGVCLPSRLQATGAGSFIIGVGSSERAITLDFKLHVHIIRRSRTHNEDLTEFASER